MGGGERCGRAVEVRTGADGRSRSTRRRARDIRASAPASRGEVTVDAEAGAPACAVGRTARESITTHGGRAARQPAATSCSRRPTCSLGRGALDDALRSTPAQPLASSCTANPLTRRHAARADGLGASARSSRDGLRSTTLELGLLGPPAERRWSGWRCARRGRRRVRSGGAGRRDSGPDLPAERTRVRAWPTWPRTRRAGLPVRARPWGLVDGCGRRVAAQRWRVRCRTRTAVRGRAAGATDRLRAFAPGWRLAERGAARTARQRHASQVNATAGGIGGEAAGTARAAPGRPESPAGRSATRRRSRPCRRMLSERLTTAQDIPTRFVQGSGEWVRAWGRTVALVGAEARRVSSTVQETRDSPAERPRARRIRRADTAWPHTAV